MNLRSIHLRDWKQFVDARFDFPAPTDERNIILIGGENGFGKTSLFEAIMLGLFGRDALIHVKGSGVAAAAVPEESYKEFLGKVLHRNALRQNRRETRITLKFEDDRGAPVEIMRTWSFTDAGALRQGASDQVRIYKGIGRETVGPPGSEVDREGWYREWIATHFLPAHLAPFFLFDGEDAAALADREKSAQVRQGIEGLLGLPWLRRLAEDLRSYAADRRRKAPGGADQTISRIESELSDLQRAMDEARTDLATARPERSKLDQDRAALMRELEAFGGASVADIGTLAEQKKAAEDSYVKARGELMRIAETDLALCLAGTRLRTATVERLKAEAVREEWEATRNRGSANLQRFLEALGAELAAAEPAVGKPAQQAALAATRKVWDAIWFPAPDGCADAFLHTHLRGSDRVRVQDRLAAAQQLSTRRINDQQRAMADAAATKRELEQRLDQAMTVGSDLEPKRERLRQIGDRIAELDRRIGGAENTERAMTPQIDEKRRRLADLTAKLNDAEPDIRRAKRAEVIAAMLDRLMTDAVPGQIAPIAAAMTEALQAMASRKDLLQRVEIDPDCTVRLLGPNRQNLLDYDLSAGEKQLFTQALISAVVKVSGRVFPMVVDTPLGRLDEAHRHGVLRRITARAGQVILISTNTEVVGPWLDEIRPRVLKAYRLDNRRQDGEGVTQPVEGYFPGQKL